MINPDTIADLSVKCTARHCKVEIFIRNHMAYYDVLLDSVFVLRKMLSTRCGPVETRFSLILGIRFSILWIRIASLKYLKTC